LRLARQLDLAGFEHVGPVGDVQRHGGILLHQQHRRAGFANVGDDVKDLLHQLRRQPQRGLVEQQQAWPRHQGPRDRQHHLLAARKLARNAAAALGEDREQLHHSVQIAAHLAVAAQIGAEPQVLEHGHGAEDLPPLGAMGEPRGDDPGRREPGEVMALVVDLERDAPGARPQVPGNGEQRRRLAGAVGTQQRDDLARLDAQADVVQDLRGAAPDLDRLKREHGAAPLSGRTRDRPRSPPRGAGSPPACRRPAARRG
jgi:hypothetical protein